MSILSFFSKKTIILLIIFMFCFSFFVYSPSVKATTNIIGYDTIGSATLPIGYNHIFGTVFSLVSSPVNITNITAMVFQTDFFGGSYDINFSYAIYYDNGTDFSYIGSTPYEIQSVSYSGEWHTIQSNIILNSVGNYLFCLQASSYGSVSAIGVYCDINSFNTYHNDTTGSKWYNSFPETFYYTMELSIYGEYVPVGSYSGLYDSLTTNSTMVYSNPSSDSQKYFNPTYTDISKYDNISSTLTVGNSGTVWATDYQITSTNLSSAYFPTGNITIGIWVKLLSTTPHLDYHFFTFGLFRNSISGNGIFITIHYDEGYQQWKLFCYAYDGGSSYLTSSGILFPTDEFHWLEISFNNQAYEQYYVDGNLINTFTDSNINLGQSSHQTVAYIDCPIGLGYVNNVVYTALVNCANVELSYITINSTEINRYALTPNQYNSFIFTYSFNPTEIDTGSRGTIDMVELYQGTDYLFTGYISLNGVQSSIGVYNVSTTGITNNEYSGQYSFSNVLGDTNYTSGTFTFDIAPRLTGSDVAYEALAISFNTTDGNNHVKLLDLEFWKYNPLIPPNQNPGNNGINGANTGFGFGNTSFMVTILEYMLLFLVPSMILGIMFGKYGFIVGLVLMFSIGYMGGIVPLWLIFLVGISSFSMFFLRDKF